MLYLDLSQFVSEPRLTGIQRAERSLIRHWPGPSAIHPCAYDPGTNTLRTLPAELLPAIAQESKTGGLETEARRLAPYFKLGAPIDLKGARILCAELFSDAARAAYYEDQRHSPAEAYWLVYDFLPWLRPGWFSIGAPRYMMPYLQALRTIPNVAFISRQVRDDYLDRVVRLPGAGPIFPMGADGLGLERQSWHPSRQHIVMLGTIEARKNTLPALKAFQRLWAEGATVGFTLIGEISAHAREEYALIQSMSGQPLFRHLMDLPDEGVRTELRTARCVLFPSEGEGYGIPPMEALHAGIPAIVAASLPALNGLPSYGQLRLKAVTIDTVAAAIRHVLNDNAAAFLWAGAAQLSVPTWAGFAADIAKWLHSPISVQNQHCLHTSHTEVTTTTD